MATKSSLPAPESLKGDYAGFVSRLIAFVVDRLIVISIIFIVTTIALVILGFFGINPDELLNSPNRTNLGKIVTLVLLGFTFLLNIVFYYSYFIFSWILIGQTPGKILMGLRIVSTDGSPITFFQAIKRIIGYWISGIVFFMGYLWVLGSDTRQGWHDKFARTYVIYTWEARTHYVLFRKLAKLAEKRVNAYNQKHNPQLAETNPTPEQSDN